MSVCGGFGVGCEVALMLFVLCYNGLCWQVYSGLDLRLCVLGGRQGAGGDNLVWFYIILFGSF